MEAGTLIKKTRVSFLTVLRKLELACLGYSQAKSILKQNCSAHEKHEDGHLGSW